MALPRALSIGSGKTQRLMSGCGYPDAPTETSKDGSIPQVKVSDVEAVVSTAAIQDPGAWTKLTLTGLVNVHKGSLPVEVQQTF